MNIFAVKLMHSYIWKYFPITEEIIEQVDKLSRDERRPTMGYGYPLFDWDPGIEINETMENY